MTELSKRLSAIAAMVDHGARFADIGTDHGYLPIYLTEQGICPSSIAMDVKDGPLSRARTHVQEAGLERRITLRKSDGFEALKPGEADTAVIAGMGGLLMIRLLENGKETVRGMRQLLLSPQSEIGQVRRYLLEHGYRISREQMILEDGKYYVILEARPGSEEPWTYIEEEFGRHLLASGDPGGGRMAGKGAAYPENHKADTAFGGQRTGRRAAWQHRGTDPAAGAGNRPVSKGDSGTGGRNRQ